MRMEAQALSAEGGSDLIIVDGSPGIGCPVIASVIGSDLAFMVVETTLSAGHDLARALQTAS